MIYVYLTSNSEVSVPPFLRQVIACLITATCCVLATGSASAATPLASADASHSSLRVYSERDRLKTQSSQWLAVEITPQEGWHTYWKNPGDSGASPILEWQLPDGISARAPRYATPKIIPAGPLANYGYSGSSVLLVELENGEKLGRSPLVLNAEWLVCDVECIPQFATLEVPLAVGRGDKVPENKELFATARAKLPEPAYWSSALEIVAQASTLTVFMTADDVEPIENARFYAGFFCAARWFDPQSDALRVPHPLAEGFRLSVRKL